MVFTTEGLFEVAIESWPGFEYTTTESQIGLSDHRKDHTNKYSLVCSPLLIF